MHVSLAKAFRDDEYSRLDASRLTRIDRETAQEFNRIYPASINAFVTFNLANLFLSLSVFLSRRKSEVNICVANWA